VSAGISSLVASCKIDVVADEVFTDVGGLSLFLELDMDVSRRRRDDTAGQQGLTLLFGPNHADMPCSLRGHPLAYIKHRYDQRIEATVVW
jgi:hypothetical protein